MARKSRWQQFADSFNAMYGTVTDAGKNIETAKVLKQDFNDDAGNPLAGSDLDRARARALADIYTKYGDAEGGIALRSNAAALEASEFENSINREVRPDLVYQRGAGKTGLMNSQINSNNASANSSNASADRTRLLSPFEARNLGLTGDNLALDVEFNRQTLNDRVTEQRGIAERATADARTARAGADVAEGTVDSRVRQGAAEADSAEANATVDAIGANLALETRDENVAAVLADLRASAEEAKTRITTAQEQREVIRMEQHARSVVGEIMQDITSRLADFESDEAASAYAIDRLSRADISPQARLAAAEAINNFGIQRLGSEAMALTTKFETAIKDGGLDGAVDAFLDTPGKDGYVERNGDTTTVFIRQEDGSVTKFAEGPEAFVTGVVADYAKDPMNSLELAAEVLDYNQKQTDINATEAGIAETQARTGLLGEQTANVAVDTDVQMLTRRLKTLEIEAAEREAAGELTNAERQTMLSKFISNDEYLQLMAYEPAIALDLRATYETAIGHPDAPPPEVMDLEAWYGLSKTKQQELRDELEKLNKQ